MTLDLFISSLDWNQLASSIASSAIISAGVSAAVNYFFTTRTMKKERELKHIEDRLSVYSVIIYNLDIIIQWYVNPPSNTINVQIQEVLQSIDNELKIKFYLLDQESAGKWMWIKRFTYQVDDTKYTELKNNIYGMRNRAAKKYNELKIPYEDIVRKKLDEIPEVKPPNTHGSNLSPC